MAVTMTTHGHRLTPTILDGLAGNVHFVRVSMDGVGLHYESIRKRQFDDLKCRMVDVAAITGLGINFVVNSVTIDDLEAATRLGAEVGARELLLLPQRPTATSPGIDSSTRQQLTAWILDNQGPIRLAICEGDEGGLPIANPLPSETGLRAYAHIDASATLRTTSYAGSGEPIGDDGVLAALRRLDATRERA